MRFPSYLGQDGVGLRLDSDGLGHDRSQNSIQRPQPRLGSARPATKIEALPTRRPGRSNAIGIVETNAFEGNEKF
jgi:hypothetical protein